MAHERKVFKDYQPSDVRDAYQHAHPRSWQDLISYLQARGLKTWHLTPGEDAHMIADARALIKDKIPFCNNWEEAYQILKSHHDPALVKEEEEHWVARTEEYEKKQEQHQQHQA
ncbi:MAG TPA: hypothetical protein VNL16_19805 [Chloroflexota bacterium]|nr:hypothetical protein [Chloroflexota bacterium]